MKKILIALFIIIMYGKSFAEPSGGFVSPFPPLYAHPDVVEYAIEKYVVPPHDPNTVRATYEKYMNTDNGTITVENLKKVCEAGGMNQTQCTEFTKILSIHYYDVCDTDKGKSNGHCEKNFFYHAAPKNLSFGNGTYVRTKEAIGLAQEYALVKDKQKVVCVSAKGKSTKDNTVWCTSIDQKHFYEFKFNNIKETKDDYIKQSLLGAICKLHNTQYSASGVGAATLGSAPGYSWPDSCETTDKFICANINKSLGRFSYKATIETSDVPPTGKHSTCIIETVVNDISNLRTAYGIDPAVFKNVQALVGEDIDKKIKQYVKQELQKQKIAFDEKSFHCADSTNVLNGGDVLTCYVNNKPIDFLFKDLSEWSGVNKRGGAQAMDCIVSGGTYTGKRCTNLNQKQCEMLQRANLQSCPTCNMVRWDAKNKVCTLPSSAAATNLQKDIKVVAIVGGAVVGAAITIGAAGLTAGGYVILGVETTGAGIELWSQSKIDGIADEFLLTSAKCKTASCAEQLIKENLQRMSNVANDMTDTERNAVDDELARLIGLLPTTSQFFIDIVAGDSLIDKNHKNMLETDSWEPEQVWRAVGITLQLASVFTAVGKWVLTKAGVLSKTLPNATSAMTRQAKQTGIEVQKMVRSGREVKTSNGRIVKIPDYANPINPSAIDDVAVRQIYQNAYDAEKIITDDMVEVTSRAGGELSGLENRMKTPESITKKVAKDRSGGKVVDGMSDADVVSGFSDIVRYTQTGSTKTLTRQIKQTLSELEAKGYRINKIKNRFNTPIGEYKDFMVQLEHVQTGQKVELQFNTPKNLILKDKGHHLYKNIDDVNSSAATKKAAQIEMQKIYSDLEIPDGIVNFVYN